MRAVLLIASVVAWLVPTPLAATEYHVSSEGSDDNDGRSPIKAWRTLDRVNCAHLVPGDVVRFRRGDAWRGQLLPRSGDEKAHITYSAYGTGDKPLLMGSIEENSPADWQHEGGNIWSTVGPTPTDVAVLPDPSFDRSPSGWSLHCENGASASAGRDTKNFHSAPASYRVHCTAPGKSACHIQLYISPFPVERGKTYRLVFWAKSSKPIVIHRPAIMKARSPWTRYAYQQGSTQLSTSEAWTKCTTYYHSVVAADDTRLAFFLGDVLSKDTTLHIDSLSLRECKGKVLSADVGNIIFDGEASCGVKVWEPGDMKAQGQYWYNEDRHTLKLFSKRNPAEHYSDIECAIRRHVISQSNTHYVIYENLAIKYGAAHGIGGAGTHHIIVRDCDFGYIGGGDQRGGKHTVRYGNGVEFWANAHDCLVERCRLWEIYDAALTNQSNSPHTKQYNLVYRNNVIWNCEYSFEYWNRPTNSKTWNVRFEDNTCVNAGHCWGHTQRPDPSGRHLCFYTSPADAKGLCIRNNVFYEAKSNAFYAPTWPKETVAGLRIDRNCWYQAKGKMIRFASKDYAMGQFDAYRSDTGMEPNSIIARPMFRDAAKLDFRLEKDSPCIDVGGDTGTKRDFDGTPIPQGRAADIGAYEAKVK